MSPTPTALDSIFEALAHKHRRDIIYALSLQPHAVHQLALMQQLSLPAIHKHIKILKNADIVTEKKVGRIHFLTLKKAALMGLQQWLMQYHPYWGTDTETLENYATYLQKPPVNAHAMAGTLGGEKK